MPKIKIEITSKAVGDRYYRIHGKSIDRDLDRLFYTTQREAIIGISRLSFAHSQTVDLDVGRHYVVYGATAWVGYWDASIKASDVVVAEGQVYTDGRGTSYLKGEFFVIPFPPYVIPIKLPVPPFESPLATVNNILVYATAPFRK